MSTFLGHALSNALFASVLAIGAALATRLTRRPQVAFAVWLLVLLKLLMPPLVAVYPITLDEPVPSGAAAEIVDAVRDEDWEAAFVGVPQVMSAESPIGVPEELHSAAQLLSAVESAEETAPKIAPAPALRQFAIDWNAVAARLSRFVPLMVWAWLLGSAIWFANAIARIGRFHRMISRALPAGADLQDEVRSVARHFGLRQVPQLRIVSRPVPPLVWSMWGRATVLVPAALIARLSPEQRTTLWAHELAHLKRRDHLTRWLELVAVGLYWWHPVAWWARRNLHRASEACCDESVVRLLPRMAGNYAEALVVTLEYLAETRPAIPPVAPAFSQVSLVKRRLEMILASNKSRRGSWPMYAAIIASGLLVMPLTIHASRAESKRDTTAKPPAAAAKTPRMSIEQRMDRLEKMIEQLTAEVAAIRAGQLEGATPVVVSTEPATGATDVDPNLTEIKVTFNKDMQDGSWSWTQNSDDTFPEAAGKIHYEANKRTCVMPVKLVPGKSYWIGINSPRFGNFKDTSLRSATPFVLTFKTKE